MCVRHYARVLRHGCPHANRKASLGGRFLKSIADTKKQECIDWPFARNHEGYPMLSKDGKKFRANRYICEMVSGSPPKADSHAAHSCGNRACVNPNHIRWATPAENIADKRAHGTIPMGERVHTAKLSEPAVREIKKMLARGEKQTAIAAKYGVTKHAISKISKGANWGWVE